MGDVSRQPGGSRAGPGFRLARRAGRPVHPEVLRMVRSRGRFQLRWRAVRSLLYASSPDDGPGTLQPRCGATDRRALRPPGPLGLLTCARPPHAVQLAIQIAANRFSMSAIGANAAPLL